MSSVFMGPPPVSDGTKLVAPSSERNKQPILDVLLPRLRDMKDDKPLEVLEIACGTGQHAAHFAEHVGELAHWIPTDVSDELFWSVRAYCAGLPNVDAPRVLDACKGTEAGDPWSLPPSSVDVVVNINMVHITAWQVTEGLFAGCGHVLKPGGRLFCYGPFKVNGACTTPSNADFDASLIARNPLWGLRDIADCDRLANAAGLHLEETIDMPSNNFCLGDRVLVPKGKHAHQRTLRGLHTAGVTDVAHSLIQSPIKPPEPAVVHSRIVSPVGSSASPLSFHLPINEYAPHFPSPAADVGGFASREQPFLLSKVYSVSDLLHANVAGVDREEVVDVSSGRVVTQVPSLADLMDYDIDPADLRGEVSLASPRPEGDGSGLTSPGGVGTFPRRRRSTVRPSTMPASHGTESSPGCFSPPLMAYLNTPAPPSTSSVRRHTAGASVRHRKLSVPSTSMEVRLPASLLGREDGPVVAPTPIAAVPPPQVVSPGPSSAAPVPAGRPSSPEPGTRRATEGSRLMVSARAGSRDSNDAELPWRGVSMKPHHGHTVARDSGQDVVELQGRGVLVRHGSKPNSLYGNMDLVLDMPAEVSAQMLTFTKSKSTLGGRMASQGSVADAGHMDLQQKLWEALYGDGCTPSNSVIVGDGDDETGSASTLSSVSNVWSIEPRVLPGPIPTSPVCSEASPSASLK